MSWTDTILSADRAGFLAVNGAHSAAADPCMVLLSDPRVWIPVYVLFLVLVKLRWGWRGLWWSLPVAALMIFCSDTGSVVFFKDTVQRLRPCHAPDLQGLVHLVDGYCGGQYGFISSHAANHFALATFAKHRCLGAAAGRCRADRDARHATAPRAMSRRAALSLSRNCVALTT